jgi:hypothetical protein
VAVLNARAAAVLRAPASVVAGGNSLQVARYTPGQHYWPHYDSRHLADLGGAAFETHLEKMGQLDDAAAAAALRRNGGFPYAARYATLLYFLRAPEAGGNLSFPLAQAAGVPREPTRAQVDYVVIGRIVALY